MITVIVGCMDERECTICGVVQPDSNFYVSRGVYLRRQCKACLNIRSTEKRYGLEPGTWGQMYVAQGGACASCRRPFGSKPPHLDHHHESGRVRKLLCARCNQAVGVIEEPGMLEAARRYLEEHQ